MSRTCSDREIESLIKERKPVWERAGILWAPARIHSPHGDSNKSHPKHGQPVFLRNTNHESRGFWY